MGKLLLEFLSAREANPAALVTLAAKHQIDLISVCILPFKQLAGEVMPFGQLPDWDLIGDTPNRRELKRRCDGEGVKIESADVFFIKSETNFDAFRPALESGAWLGAARVTIILLDDNLPRLAQSVMTFCDIANDYGLGAIFEHSPRMAVKTVRDAIAFKNEINKPNLTICLDALHVYRSGSKIEDLAALRASDIGRFQLCDGPAQAPPQGGGYEAFYERMIPGEGDFPLKDYIAAVPDSVTFGIEVPLWTLQQSGVEPSERVRRIVEASRKLLGK